MAKQFIIEGSAIHDIPSFYEELNRVFMSGESWKIGASLDAFNDLLFGGFGAMAGAGESEIVWKDADHSREALGYAVTKRYYEEKLRPGFPFNQEHFRRQLEALERGEGRTYFDLLMEVIAEHPGVTFRFLP